MNIQSKTPSFASLPKREAGTRYRIQVGETTYPVMKDSESWAKGYDGDENGIVSEDEIADAIQRGSARGPLTKNPQDGVMSLRQHMAGLKSPYLDHYPTGEQIESRLAELAAAHPNKAEVLVIGHSNEGQEIKALRVSDDLRTDKPAVFITGNMHAREWATNMAVSSAAEKTLNGEADDATADVQVYFVPNANPDGYRYSREVTPYWRKNTSRDESGNVVGVDLNRNMGHQFRFPGDQPHSIRDDKGGSDNPQRYTYRGTGPFSEPEARAVKNLLHSEQEPLGYLDVHSCGQLVLLPDGDNAVSSQEYKQIGDAVNQAISGADYKVINDFDLYPATGTASRYADSLGMVGMAIEIGTSRQPPPEKIESLVDTASDGIVEFIHQMHQRTQSA